MPKQLPKWRDFIDLLFPNLCVICQQHLNTAEHKVCFTCTSDLPLTNFHLDTENIMAQQFWGRVSIKHASALYLFTKTSKTQSVIHALKYKNQQQVGIDLGNILGEYLSQSPIFCTIDYVIPVPLHLKKYRQRGYNQSNLIGRGVSQTLKKTLKNDILIRKEYTSTQTQKTRTERFDNVKTAFQVINPKAIQGKHLLLIDDVMTTGATLEACALALHKAGNVEVSVATLAFANQV